MRQATLRQGYSKRQLVAMVARRIGLLAAIRAARLNRGLLVLAYHRIGDPSRTPVADNLFSGSRSDLAEQVRLLQRWLRVVGLDEIGDRYRAAARVREPLAVLTFDDAYQDNYSEA